MEVLVVIALIVYVLAKSAVQRSVRKAKARAAQKPAQPSREKAPAVPCSTPPRLSGETVPARSVRAQKREQMTRAAEWRAAKRQQDDAEQVHSVHMDTCESRLESLRILYDAGILDREEYAQRVARTRARHFDNET